jgi:hypothetical protein
MSNSVSPVKKLTTRQVAAAGTFFTALALVFSNDMKAKALRNLWHMRSVAHDAWVEAGGEEADADIGDDPLFVGKTTGAVYKIRHRVTGQYSTGGYYPQFRDKGKLWVNRAAMMASLSQLNSRRRSEMDDWEIVEIKTVEMSARSVREILDAKEKLRAEKEQRRMARVAKAGGGK